jgi:transcriptional regulator of arginine metabolism
MKNKRQEAIVEIISNQDIETQEVLLDKLHEKGFEVTQATISRDIRELEIIKVVSKNGIYKYAIRTTEDQRPNAKYMNIMRETVVSIDYANNLVVIKTFSGMAQAAAAAIDALFSSEILGTIAGDDTIFVATHNTSSAQSIVHRIKDPLNIK